jgi:hypothetical protein
MKKAVIIGNGRHHNIIKSIRELTEDEMKNIGVIDVSELRDIPCFTTNSVNIITGGGYCKQKKPNYKNII